MTVGHDDGGEDYNDDDGGVGGVPGSSWRRRCLQHLLLFPGLIAPL